MRLSLGLASPTARRRLVVCSAVFGLVLLDRQGAAIRAASSPDETGGEVWITLGATEAEFLVRHSRDQDRPLLDEGRILDRRHDVVVAAVADEAIDGIARALHRQFHRCGGFMVHPSREAALEALAQEDVKAPVAVTYSIDNGPVAQALIDEVRAANIVSTITHLSGYTTRYYTSTTGVQAAQWLKSHWQGLAQGRSDVTTELFTHSGWAQPSVILSIAGTSLPNEVVIVGGHLDSINRADSGPAPGADDDASGVATFTEALRAALAKGYRPARTVKFMAYAAEEVGLRGSAEIATAYKNAGVNVVGVLQLDMTNYKGSTPDIVIMTDRTSAAQNAFLGDLVDTYLPGLARSTSQCGYACSDHASWNSKGYAASIPFEALMGQYNPKIHTSQDTLAQSGGNASHAQKFARLTAAYLAELAKGTLDPSGGDTTPPATSITSPAGGATVSGSVTVTANASDDVGVTKVELHVDGGLVATDLSSPYSFAWNSTSVGNGLHGLAAKAYDAAGNSATSPTVTVTVSNSATDLTAAYDATLKAPRCAAAGRSCDSAGLLLGRDGKGPEPNQPNTMGASCSDGTSGTYHVDESNDRIKVSTTDGGAFTPGKTVRIEATVWAYSSYTDDKLDLYYAANASSPSWVFLKTLAPAVAGSQTLSATYTLPSGGLQAVRARFRYRGSAAACGTGSYNDHDDLVFAVQ